MKNIAVRMAKTFSRSSHYQVSCMLTQHTGAWMLRSFELNTLPTIDQVLIQMIPNVNKTITLQEEQAFSAPNLVPIKTANAIQKQ